MFSLKLLYSSEFERAMVILLLFHVITFQVCFDIDNLEHTRNLDLGLFFQIIALSQKSNEPLDLDCLKTLHKCFD